MKTITIYNGKESIDKLVFNISFALSLYNKKILIVDYKENVDNLLNEKVYQNINIVSCYDFTPEIKYMYDYVFILFNNQSDIDNIDIKILAIDISKDTFYIDKTVDKIMIFNYQEIHKSNLINIIKNYQNLIFSNIKNDKKNYLVLYKHNKEDELFNIQKTILEYDIMDNNSILYLKIANKILEL